MTDTGLVPIGVSGVLKRFMGAVEILMSDPEMPLV
jgi:hypothetical protein